MNAPGGRDATGIGLCLGAAGAVIAVIRQDPMRLAAIATLTWPAELWRPSAPTQPAMAAGQRVLARARHRLGLPRWCPVAVVAGPSLSLPGTPSGTPCVAPEWIAPRSAELLARSAMVQGWVIAPERAAMLRACTPLTVDDGLSAAMAGVEAETDLAAGAAIAVVLPPAPGKGGTAPAEDKPAGIAMSALRMDRATGWAVQPAKH